MPTQLEAVVVYTVVAFCAVYCVWLFMPATMKRWMANALLRRFPRLQAWSTLQAATRDPAGCGSACGNCASAGARPPAQEHQVHWAKKRRSPPG
ncbi:hypothetical protein B0B52_06950 [Polaromonas sp. A23]|nr:hypothetical protein B0B52_06950 [Polaromonas sp. A23]